RPVAIRHARHPRDGARPPRRDRRGGRLGGEGDAAAQCARAYPRTCRAMPGIGRTPGRGARVHRAHSRARAAVHVRIFRALVPLRARRRRALPAGRQADRVRSVNGPAPEILDAPAPPVDAAYAAALAALRSPPSATRQNAWLTFLVTLVLFAWLSGGFD